MTINGKFFFTFHLVVVVVIIQITLYIISYHEMLVFNQITPKKTIYSIILRVPLTSR